MLIIVLLLQEKLNEAVMVMNKSLQVSQPMTKYS